MVFEIGMCIFSPLTPTEFEQWLAKHTYCFAVGLLVAFFCLTSQSKVNIIEVYSFSYNIIVMARFEAFEHLLLHK